MNNTFKVGDKVKRSASAMDSFWKEQCRRYNVEIDATFEVVSPHGTSAIQLKGLEPGFGYTLANFKLVEFAKPSEETKMREAYELAKSLIGKTIVCDNESCKRIVTGVLSRKDNDDSGLGYSCKKFLNENGWVVGVRLGAMNYPVQKVSEVPTELNVQLNDSFAATITKGKVKINGVTFPIEKIQEIIESHNKL
jgi:hypothetical protein